MWLGWFESVDIYLGQGVVLLQQGKKAVQVIRPPVTWGLERILAGIAQALAQVPGNGSPITVPLSRKAFLPVGWGKRRRFHIVLGATLCPATGFTAPKEVHRLDELRSIALASVTAAHAGQQVVCEIDPMNPGVAASVSNALLSELHRWAGSQGGKIASIHPIWSVASGCRAAHGAKNRGLALQEPGALTLLAEKPGGGLDALTLTGEWDEPQLQGQLRRWQVAQALGEKAALCLKFGPDIQTCMAHGPAIWAGHWSRL